MRAPRQARTRVAYVMSRFPKLTETFILSEIVEMDRMGVETHIYPLLRERPVLVQPAVAALVDRVHYLPLISWTIIRSQVRFVTMHPRRYVRALAALVRGAWRSPRFLFGGLAIFPKVAHMAMVLRADGVDHVHCHFANHPTTAGFLIHRLTGIPYSFTAHGSDLHKDQTMLCEKIASASVAITISEYNRDLMQQACGGQRTTPIEVIHCGVDTGRFVPPAREPAGPPVIICVGTLHEVKGQSILIDACIELGRRGVAFRCRLVGDGVDRSMLEARVADGRVADRVEFVGPKTSEEVLELLHHSHVLAAPSVPTRTGKREGIPVVLMEGMSTGRAVIASRLSGIPELVKDEESGLLVPPGDAMALADALERLLTDPELRHRLGDAARQTVLAHFDAGANARVLARHFRSGNS